MKLRPTHRRAAPALLAAASALCLTLAPARADDAAPAAQPLPAQPLPAQPIAKPLAQPMTRRLGDRDDLRAIEVLSDRREAVGDFFGRQKLIIASLVPAGKVRPLGIKEVLGIAAPTQFYADYPWFTDKPGGLWTYQSYFVLAPPSAETKRLLSDNAEPAGPVWFVLALDTPGAMGTPGDPAKARLVGTIRRLSRDDWSLNSPGEQFQFKAPPQDAAPAR